MQTSFREHNVSKVLPLNLKKKALYWNVRKINKTTDSTASHYQTSYRKSKHGQGLGRLSCRYIVQLMKAGLYFEVGVVREH